MKKKVCKKCKIFYEGKTCPICKGNQSTTTWKGRVNILDVNKTALAKKIDCTYSHVVKILQEMEKASLVNFEKTGRLKLLTLVSI